MVELYHNCQSDNGSLTDRHALRRWSMKMLSSLEEIKDLRAPLRLSQMMSNAGYTDLQSRMIPLPLCDWSTGNFSFISSFFISIPFDRIRSSYLTCESRVSRYGLTRGPYPDPRNREIGRINSENISVTLGSLALYTFTERLGMSSDEISLLLSQACSEANDRSLKAYFPLCVPPVKFRRLHC